MMRILQISLPILAIVLGAAGCASLEQMNRDNLRYQSIDRGREVYSLRNLDSLEAAQIRNEQEIDLYQRHIWTAKGWVFPQTYSNLEMRVLSAIAEMEKLSAPYIQHCSGDSQERAAALGLNDAIKSRRELSARLATDFSSAAAAKNDVETVHVKLRLKQLQDQVKRDRIELDRMNVGAKARDCSRRTGGSRQQLGGGVGETGEPASGSPRHAVEVNRANDEAHKYFLKVAQPIPAPPFLAAPVPPSPVAAGSSGTVNDASSRKGRSSSARTQSNKGGNPKAEEKQSTGKEIDVKQFPVAAAGDPRQLDQIWPEAVINSITSKTQTKLQDGKAVEITQTRPDPDLVRALSSSAAISQMRDLLTEPSFPPLLPTERRIDRLGCLAPPDSAAFEAVAKLEASLKKDGATASIGTEFASTVVKLFEESERTLFLQYALFRLCEMSINAPAGFRNVYPVVVHDIVRRTAEMTELANKEAEVRRAEEEKTRQRQADLKIKEKEIELLRERRYTECVTKRLEKDASNIASIKSDCAALMKGEEAKK